MLSKEYIIVIVCSVVALILVILYFTKDKILNKQSNILSNPPNETKTETNEPTEPKISVLDLTPYTMEQALEKSCVTINQEDAVNQLSKQYMDMIQDRNFLRDKQLMEMARYSPSIIEKALCLKNYEFEKFIATGAGGIVMLIKDKVNQKAFVVKLMLYNLNFIYEVQSFRKFMKLGIGVDIYQACRVTIVMNKDTDNMLKVGLLVMEKVDDLLDRIMLDVPPNEEEDKKNAQIIGPQILHIFEVMEKNHISHNDLHVGNIGLMGDEKKLKMFDFGSSSVLCYYPRTSLTSFIKSIIPDRYMNKGLLKELWNVIGNQLIQKFNSTYDDNEDDYAPPIIDITDAEVLYIRFFHQDLKTEIKLREAAYEQEKKSYN